MPYDEIEIAPGKFIQIPARVKKLTRAPVLGLVTLEQAQKAAGFIGKHSILLLDEAVELARLRGMDEAIRLTGIPHKDIKRHWRRRYPVARAQGSRYTLAQKQAVVALAMELRNSGETVQVRSGKKGTRLAPKWPIEKAFVEAGRRLGVNGNSVMCLYYQGQIPSSEQVERAAAAAAAESGRPVPPASDDAGTPNDREPAQPQAPQSFAPRRRRKRARRRRTRKPRNRPIGWKLNRLLKNPALLEAISRDGLPNGLLGPPLPPPPRPPALLNVDVSRDRLPPVPRGDYPQAGR